MQAMVLAAGYGTRLKPFSVHKPKPLFPVLNKPLLLATVERLKNNGFSSIGINCSHLGEQIIASTQHLPGVIIQEEKQILGTGGAIRQRVVHCANTPLLVSNGDIYHSIDFKKIYQAHCRSGAAVSLVLHDYPRFNTVGVAGDKIVSFTSPSGRAEHYRAYTGIQVVEPGLLKGLRPGSYACIIDYYRELLAQGETLNTIVVDNCFWTDMGTPADYLQLHAQLLTGQAPVWSELEAGALEPLYLSEAAMVDHSCRLAQWVCVGRATIGRDAVIKRAVIWDGARVSDGAEIVDTIVIPDRG